MSNEFDIERAKAGEPVERVCIDEPRPVEFLARWDDFCVVCRIPGYLTPQLIPIASLRMAPKKIKVRWRVALVGTSGLTLIANDECHERVIERGEWGEFKQWLTGWQEAEIEQ